MCMNDSLRLRVLTAACVTAFLLLGAAAAYGQDKYCPGAVSVRTQEVTQAPAGWQVRHDPAPHNLAGITFYDGPPEQLASLVYEDWKKVSPVKAVASWKFHGGAGNVWISCSYASTDVILAQPLPKSISECTVTYNPQSTVAGFPEIKAISCKSGKS